MSKFIKYNDFIQISPDTRVLSLDRKEKIILIDNLLSNIERDKKGLVITYDLSHSGRKINNRIYSTKGQQKGIDSLTNPYPKPILKHHDQNGEPIGRFIGGEWQNLNDEAASFLNSNKSMLDVHNAFTEDNPKKIYETLKDLNLLDNKKWPGLGRMRVQANITDEEAIEKFLDGRYLTFSAGSTTDRHVCSICDQDWVSEGMCEHRHGKMYDGEMCVFITGDFIVLEGSVVNTPADDLSQIVEMELIDTLNTKTMEDEKEKFSYAEEIILSDSNYNLGEIDGLQTAKQIESNDNEKEENKEEESEEILVDEKFDHEMTISERSMKKLHETGVTYVTQSAGQEKMIIKINYSGSMRKVSTENETDFESFENEISELVEELVDAKTFKVPAGAKGNAQKVLKWKKEKGSEVKGMTPVGWARARQLATKSEIGLSTVKRMAAFNRHRKNATVDPKFKSEPWKDRGYVAWLGWGGTSGIDWAIKISASNDSLIDTSFEENEKPLDETNTNNIKDSNMDQEINETEHIIDDSEKRQEEETKSPPPVEPEPEEETLDDSLDVDWNILDLALQATMSKADQNLSLEDREALEDAVFCGPNRSFPIPDCAHAVGAKELIVNAKFSEEIKDKLIAMIDEKAESLECDSEVNNLKSELEDLKIMYKSLEEKFKTVVEFIENNKKVSDENNEDLEINLEKNEDTVENSTKDELNLKETDEKTFNISDKVLSNMNQVESPSEHADEEALINKQDALSSLGSFEQKIVTQYKNILSEHGKDAANSYLYSKSTYLPRGFNPNNF